jgi:4-hydroxybenzoate polyprenyltransferase
MAPAATAPTSARDRIVGLARLLRPYSITWTASSIVVMVVLLTGGDFSTAELAGCLFAMSAIGAAARTLNDVADRATDELSTEADRRSRPVVTGVVPARMALAQAAVLCSAGLAVAFAVDLGFGILMALGALGLVLYSAGPAPVAGLPLSQGFWIAFWTTVYVSLYLALEGDLGRGVPYLVSTCLFMGVGETIAKDLRDLENDAKAGRRTTPLLLGPRRSVWACFVAYAAGGVGFVVTAALRSPDVRLPIAVGCVVLLWVARCVQSLDATREGYVKEEARVLHVGSVRVFLAVNLLLLTGIPLVSD